MQKYKTMFGNTGNIVHGRTLVFTISWYLAAAAQHHKRVLHHISLVQEKDQNSKFEVHFY